MKKPKDHLHRIIASMTPSEKRYHKIHFGQSAGSLTDLFDIVNAMTIYDEDLVKKRLGKASKNLKVYKVQLTELLLKSLTLFHSKKSVSSKIRMGLEEVDVLMEKELYEIAVDRLEKLRKLCLEYQEYPALIEIIQRDFRLNHIRYDKIGQSQIPLFEELRNCIDTLQEQFKYAELGNRILDLKRKKEVANSYTKEEVAFCQRLLSSDFLQADFSPRSIRAQLSRNTLLTFLNDIIGSEAISADYREKSVALFQANKAYARHHSFDYLGTLRNLVNIYTQQEKFAKAALVIQEAKTFAEKNKIHREQLAYFLYAEITIHYMSGDFDKIVEKSESEVTKLLKKFGIAQDRIGIITHIYLAITHLVLENYKQVHFYLRQLEHAAIDLQKYFLEVYAIVELISHFQSGDHLFLENLLNSKYRQLAKLEVISPFYRELLRFFKKLIAEPFRSDNLAQAFLVQMKRMEKEKVLGIFLYFKLDRWLEALANRHSFRQSMQIKKA